MERVKRRETRGKGRVENGREGKVRRERVHEVRGNEWVKGRGKGSGGGLLHWIWGWTLLTTMIQAVRYSVKSKSVYT